MNTKFYHTPTVVRKGKKSIKALKSPNDEWITDLDMHENMVQGYYKKVFIEDDRIRGETTPQCLSGPTVSSIHLHRIPQPFTKEEIRAVVFNMAPLSPLARMVCMQVFINTCGKLWVIQCAGLF